MERPKSIKAVHGNWFMGHWHVWAEKQYHQSNSTISTVDQAKAQAQRAYAYLEKVLQTCPEIFVDQGKFSVAGLTLLEHLLHAVANVHLATVLAQYPALCHYAQTVWQEYFAHDHDDNACVNASNAFFFLPTQETFTSTTPTGSNDPPTWHARLTVLARQGATPQKTKPRVDTVPNATTASTSAPPPQAESTAQAAVAAYQTADQRWLATVVVVGLVALARTVVTSPADGGDE